MGQWGLLWGTGSSYPRQTINKFVDDLSTLEVINLLTVGISSLLFKNQVPSDIPERGQFIAAENLKSQNYLNAIND